ncbi:MAG: Asp-tRNA(Asn)/Glu-tRNA(Gln) amidotransferase subunit GatA [Clostridiales bacterium]|nr:Asp-tRNA(Asn)/Glu-tRNA(Gln) amidotransferase subunit GatA [Clostridiales bacterium]MCD7827849.1 Asp-tRNA(Asn)/Glu-tRNA(Gln) amidotransferase subunit GatA [Clostridiales bacterium]
MNITDLTVKELSEKLHKREISAVDAAEEYFSKIENTDDEIGAFVRLTREAALKQAENADKAIAEGSAAALTGIPYGMKDNICTRGSITSCASKMLENFVPPFDAFVTKKMQEANAVMLGKMNMDEFAMGSTTENSAFHVTKNPRDTSCVPGGSSGGSAAAVAAGETAFALGSDTGGSIRQPAAFCGVVGLKPTYGTVSRNGLVAFASSLDQIGPLARTVEDAAIILNAIAGHDPLDSTSVDREYGDFTADIGMGVKGMKAALPKEYFGQGIHPEIKEAVMNAAKAFEKMGAEIEEVSIPAMEYALPAYYVISSSEASSNLARFDGVRYGYRAQGDFEEMDDFYKNTRSEGFGKEVKRRIMLGSFALSSGYYDAYYKKALQVRTLIINDFNSVFEKHDFIISPVAPTTAYKIGEKTADPVEMYLGDIYTVPVNIAGLPGLSMPCGKDGNGLPIGMQLIGKAFSESTLLRAGYAYENYAG